MADLDELDSPGARFEWFITDCYGGVPAYVEKFDFNASQVYRTISNSSSPRLETCVSYAATGINVHWMASGEGQWWAPNDIGRELAKKKGIVVEGEETGSSAIDYAVLVDVIFEIAKEGVVEKLADQHRLFTGFSSHHSSKKGNKNKTSR